MTKIWFLFLLNCRIIIDPLSISVFAKEINDNKKMDTSFDFQKAITSGVSDQKYRENTFFNSNNSSSKIYSPILNNLTLGIDNNVRVVRNTRIEGKHVQIEAPEIINIAALDKGIVLITWRYSFRTGGRVEKFIVQYNLISTQLENKPSSKNSSSIEFPAFFYETEYSTQLDLLSSTIYKISVEVVTSQGRNTSFVEIETKSSLVLEYDPTATVNNKKTQINIFIPPIINNTRDSVLHVIVKGPSICSRISMLSYTYKEFIEMEHHEIAWNAAILWAKKRSNSLFTIGNNENYDGIVNCPLSNNASYVVILLVHEKDANRYRKPQVIIWKSETLRIGPAQNIAHEIWAIPLVCFILIVGGAIYYYKEKLLINRLTF